MKKQFSKFMTLINEEGFSLIELIIVISIIGILIIMAVPIMSSSKEVANRQACQSNLTVLSRALETYNALNKEYPNLEDNPNTEWSNVISPENTIVDPDNDETDLVPELIKSVPVCPSAGIYTYHPPGPGSTAHVTCNVPEHVI